MARETAVERLTPIGVMVVIYSAYFRWFARIVKPDEHPDEPHHITYVMDVLSGRITPNYTSGASGSYLEHPFLYYFLTGKFSAFFTDPYTGMHVANYLFGLAGVLVIYDFAKTISGDRVQGLVAAVCAIMLPYFTYLATGVNNDNMATLVVFAVAASVARFYVSKSDNWFHLGVIFVLIASLVKVTSAIQAGMLLLPACIIVLRAGGFSSILSAMKNPFLSATLALVISYYIFMIISYGEPFPRPTNFYVMARDVAPQLFTDKPMGLISYLHKYYDDMLTQMPGIYSHTVYTYTVSYLNFWSLSYSISLLICLFSTFSERLRYISIGILGALCVFSFMHVFVMFRMHQKTGYLGGIQFRYYLPLAQILIAFSISVFLSVRISQTLRLCVGVLCLYAFISHDAKRYMTPAFIESRQP